MRKKKGIALPSAIVLCSLLLIVSLGITGVVIEVAVINRVNNYHVSNNLYYEEYAERFAKGENPETFPADKVNWRSVASEENTNIKALIAERNNRDGDLVFYTIYDFENNKYLAFQTSDFYFTYNDGYIYLGGIIKYKVA